jgi:predicted nucleotidyltransferase
METPHAAGPVGGYPSLVEVQRGFAAALLRKADALQTLLRACPEKSGRFVLFGSVARRSPRPDSDVDLLIDFPPAAEDAAFTYAEAACSNLRIKADMRPYRYCSAKFLAHIAPDMVVIQP